MEMLDLIKLWEQNDKKSKIKNLIDNNLVFFFKKNNELFGCPEDSRLIFAKLKHPDEEYNNAWAKEAAFLALNLSKALSAEETPKMLFYKKDLDGLDIVDKSEIDKLFL